MPKKIKESTMKKNAKKLVDHVEIFENAATKKDLENLATKRDLNETKQDVSKLKTDVAVLKTDVAVLKTDVAVLKTDVAVLKADVREIRTDLNSFKNETITRLDKIIATQERHEQERMFAYEQTRRHEEQIDKHTDEIKEIKEVLNIK